MIKCVNYNKLIKDKVNGNTYPLSDFIADSASDLAIMNATGSDYLNYPSGSSVLITGTKKVYVLNAAKTEYVEV